MTFSIILTPQGTQLFPICCKCTDAGAAMDANCASRQEALRFIENLARDGHVAAWEEPERDPAEEPA